VPIKKSLIHQASYHYYPQESSIVKRLKLCCNEYTRSTDS